MVSAQRGVTERSHRRVGLALAVVAVAVAIAVYWFGWRRSGGAPDGRPSGAASGASSAGARSPAVGSSAPGDPASAEEPKLALDCARPTGDAARVDELAVTVARLCGRLRSLGGVDRGSATADRTQARFVLDRLVDATLVHRAFVASGATVAAADLDEALAALGPADDQLAPDLVREEMIERLELDQLLPSRGRVDVTDADVDAEVARGAPGIDRGGGVRVEGYLARALETAPPADDQQARLAAEAFAASVGGGPPTVPAPPLTALAPFVLSDDSIERALDEAVRGLAPGAWTGAVRTRAGWVVVRVLGRVEPSPADAAFRDRVRDALRRRRLDAERKDVMTALRAGARVQVLLPL